MKIDIRHPEKDKPASHDAYVVFAVLDPKKRRQALETLPGEIRKEAALSVPAETGADGSLFTLPLAAAAPAKRLYVFGAGKSRELSPRKARALLLNVIRTLGKNGEASALLDFPFTLQRLNAEETRELVLRSLLLSGYTFPLYKSEAPERREVERLQISLGRGPWEGVERRLAENEIREAQTVARASRLVKDLGNTPSNDLVPRLFAERARREARERGVAVRVLDKKAITRERMGGLLAVSRGSAEEPRFVVLEYSGGRKGEPPIALVGKGITFDSGGISIKPAERMGDMKWDMMGAATVVGTVLAAADLNLPVNLVGLTPLSENLPSGTAYKPGDIVRFRSGKTAEIDNTDAEGRVVLADALNYAAKWKPQVIVDYATLTGAALVALGLEAAIVFSDDEALVSELIAAGERTDERIWRLPMWDEYKEALRSEWADFKNTGGRYGGSINGAMFLKEFVDKKTPWAHLDIAATAYFEKEHAGYPAGATAFGVALTIRWLKDRIARKPKG